MVIRNGKMYIYFHVIRKDEVSRCTLLFVVNCRENTYLGSSWMSVPDE